MQGREHLRSGQDQEAEADHQTPHDRERAEPGGFGRTAVGPCGLRLRRARQGGRAGCKERPRRLSRLRSQPRGARPPKLTISNRRGQGRAQPRRPVRMRQARVMSSSGLTNRRPVGGYPKIESVPRMSIIATKATVIGVVLVARLGRAGGLGLGRRRAAIPAPAPPPRAHARPHPNQRVRHELALPSPGGGTPRRCRVLRSSIGSNAAIASVSCASAGNCSAGGSYTDGSGHQAGLRGQRGRRHLAARPSRRRAPRPWNRGGGAAVRLGVVCVGGQLQRGRVLRGWVRPPAGFRGPAKPAASGAARPSRRPAPRPSGHWQDRLHPVGVVCDGRQLQRRGGSYHRPVRPPAGPWTSET